MAINGLQAWWIRRWELNFASFFVTESPMTYQAKGHDEIVCFCTLNLQHRQLQSGLRKDKLIILLMPDQIQTIHSIPFCSTSLNLKWTFPKAVLWPVIQWLNYVLLAMKARRVSKSRAPRCLPTGTPFLNRMRVGNPGTSYLSASLVCLVASTIAICTNRPQVLIQIEDSSQSGRHNDGTE